MQYSNMPENKHFVYLVTRAYNHRLLLLKGILHLKASSAEQIENLLQFEQKPEKCGFIS